MIETVVRIANGRYPFDELPEKGFVVKVEDVQNFKSLRELSEKKNEMIKKGRLINSPYIIKLLKLYQDDISLHYVYEHVPNSFSKYIQKNYSSGSRKIVEMSTKLFFKKISYEIAMLISTLIEMKIEIDLSMDTIGLTDDEKVKVFMSAKCRMGHKTELSLIAHYNSRKEKIIACI
jgi:hypothetical protein